MNMCYQLVSLRIRVHVCEQVCVCGWITEQSQEPK